MDGFCVAKRDGEQILVLGALPTCTVDGSEYALLPIDGSERTVDIVKVTLVNSAGVPVIDQANARAVDDPTSGSAGQWYAEVDLGDQALYPGNYGVTLNTVSCGRAELEREQSTQLLLICEP